MAARRIVLSGCSGGGKSTLLAEMARRGWEVCEEPGRRVVRSGLPCVPVAERVDWLEALVARQPEVAG